MEQIHTAEPDLALERAADARATEFSMIPLRVASAVLGFCGVVGALLAALGVFGLVAYAVSLRTREIGIRVALGAGRGALTRLVGLQAFRPVAIGLAIGLALSVALGGAIRGMLVGVQPIDPVSLAVCGRCCCSRRRGGTHHAAASSADNRSRRRPAQRIASIGVRRKTNHSNCRGVGMIRFASDPNRYLPTRYWSSISVIDPSLLCNLAKLIAASPGNQSQRVCPPATRYL